MKEGKKTLIIKLKFQQLELLIIFCGYYFEIY